MTNTITIPLNFLKALQPFQSTEQVRYYLNGVLFENKNNKLTLTATDGHRLLSIDTKAELPENFNNFILSKDDVKILLNFEKNYRKKEKDSGLFVSVNAENRQEISFKVLCNINDIVFNHAAKPVDGNFPDYMQVFPKITRNHNVAALSAFNATYLLDAAKSLAILLGQKVPEIKLFSDVKGGPCYAFSDVPKVKDAHLAGYTCVIMPMRSEACYYISECNKAFIENFNESEADNAG